MSRFEARLLDAIRDEKSEAAKSVLRLVWAAYRVRIGDVLGGRAVVNQVRDICGQRYQAQIFAHINFVEGLCEYFEGGIDAALPKLLRSKALSKGCPVSDDLPVLVGGWLAAAYRNKGQWGSMAVELIEAIRLREHFSDEALCRIGLVAADAFQEVERYGDAAYWYSYVRQRALSIGDDAVLSALLYNRAAIRVFNARIAEIRDGHVDLAGTYVELEAASAKNYTLYIRDASMDWGFDLMSGQLALLKGDYESALKLLDSPKVQGLDRQWPAVDVVRRADVFRCRAMLGALEVGRATATAEAIERSIVTLSSPGDRAIALNSLLVGLEKCQVVESVGYVNLARSSLNLHADERRKESDELSKFMSASEAIIH